MLRFVPRCGRIIHIAVASLAHPPCKDAAARLADSLSPVGWPFVEDLSMLKSPAAWHAAQD